MIFDSSPDTVTHAIQLAVAPVFLLTAVTGMIGAAAGRLARIIDRARVLEDKIETVLAHTTQGSTAAIQPHTASRAGQELGILHKRAKLCNLSIALLTLCSLLIGVTIVALFVNETTALNLLSLPTICFLAGVSCFLLALICFLAETILATHILRFGRNLGDS